MRKTIEELLNSDITAYQISKDTGINESSLYALIRGERKIGNLTLDTAEKLYKYATEKNIAEINKE